MSSCDEHFSFFQTPDEVVRKFTGAIAPKKPPVAENIKDEQTKFRSLNVSDAIPANFDWRFANPRVLSPIRNQGQCGSCWGRLYRADWTMFSSRFWKIASTQAIFQFQPFPRLPQSRLLTTCALVCLELIFRSKIWSIAITTLSLDAMAAGRRMVCAEWI